MRRPYDGDHVDDDVDDDALNDRLPPDTAPTAHYRLTALPPYRPPAPSGPEIGLSFSNA